MSEAADEPLFRIYRNGEPSEYHGRPVTEGEAQAEIARLEEEQKAPHALKYSWTYRPA